MGVRIFVPNTLEYRSSLVPIWSEKSTSQAVFVPLSNVIPSAFIKNVRAARYIESDTGAVSAAIAYRLSDDGMNWTSTLGLVSYSTVTGWVYSDGTASSPTISKLYIQFGMLVKNQSGSSLERAAGALQIVASQVNARVFATDEAHVWTDGSTSNIFHPLTAEFSVDEASQIRASIDVEGNTGDCVLQPAYQVSNDGVSWYSGAASASAGTFTTIGSSRSTNGTTYGTTFSSYTPSEKKRYIRFGVAAKNGTAGQSEAAKVSIQVDLRD